MTGLEKLADLLDRAHHSASCVAARNESEGEALEEEARYLLTNGVMMQQWYDAGTDSPKEWRDSNKRLIDFLVHCKGGKVCIGNYLGYAKHWVTFGVPTPVTHWMPLPEPPKVVNTKICNYSQKQPILRIKLKQDKPENWIVKEDLSLYEKISKQYSIEQSSYKSCEHSYVESISHGEWEHDICSICGAEWFDWINMRPFATNYCPSCGAKMDGGKEI